MVLALPISVFLAGIGERLREKGSKEEGRRRRRVKEGEGEEMRRRGKGEDGEGGGREKRTWKAQSEAYLLPSKNVLVEVELQLFIGNVDTQLLK